MSTDNENAGKTSSAASRECGVVVGGKCLVVLVTVAIVLSSVALVVALISLTYPGGGAKVTLTEGSY